MDKVVIMQTHTTHYDIADHLRTPEEMAAYLDACITEADGDTAFIAKALLDVIRARGMDNVARETSITKEGLYNTLTAPHSPEFSAILRIVKALGLQLYVTVAKE